MVQFTDKMGDDGRILGFAGMIEGKQGFGADRTQMIEVERLYLAGGSQPMPVSNGSEVMLTLFGLMGSVEKYFAKARQRRGIEAEKLRGVYKGRPPSIRPEDVRKLRAEGMGATDIAKRLRIGRASVYRALAA